ncbi:MAG TPA: two-component regulator propeller domain-containing protein [Methylomirabilota bacterium]|nr:two-component regulator propeller domain-containing protein [Methylomirabilota bacterium]
MRPRLFATLLVLLTVPPGVRSEESPEFFFQTWESEHGLPQNHSTAIVQTRDGYLWLGTYNGLVRFDGVRFVVFSKVGTPGLSSSRVTCLWEGTDGSLWLGHDGGELTRYRSGTFEAVALGPNWPGGQIADLGEDAAHDLWLLHQSGLAYRVRDGHTERPEVPTAGPTVISLARDAGGTLWRVHHGRLRPLGATDGPSVAPASAQDDFAFRACGARDGGLWVTGSRWLRRWSREGRLLRQSIPPWAGESVTAMLEGDDGTLWVGTLGRGLYVMSDDGRVQHFSRTNGLPHDWVRSLGRDREGTVWVGTGGGLSAARLRRVTMVQPPDQWQGRAVLAVTEASDGSMWIGTEGGGLYRLQDGAWTRFDEAQGLSNRFVWSVTEDRRQRLWAGTWGGGLFRWQQGRFVIPGTLTQERTPVCALLAGSDGSLWVGTQMGLLRLTDQGVERLAEHWLRADVRAVAEAADGTVWFGMSGGGLGRWRDGVLSQFREADGLPSDYVWSLLAEPDGTLWVGTFGGGLCRWRGGRFATIGTPEGLPNNVICHIVDDGRGQLWFGSYGGILRASKEDLHRCADGRTRTVSFFAYGKADGLATRECSGGLQPSGCHRRDGRLWFPTSKGLAVVDPTNLRTNLLPPPVVIEEVLVDGVAARPVAASLGQRPAILPGAAARLVVPPGHQRFEFRFTALSFKAPERVRFRYRLGGLENDWVDGGTQRFAQYSFLAPGDYTFRVIACNNDGIWNETGATLALTVQPYFWQTWPFRLAVGLTAAALVAGLVRGLTRRRYRRRIEQLARQRAVEKERARIAQDIHDDLGASLTRITMLSQSARSECSASDPAAADLDQIYETARELTRAMDEIVWAVNPHHDTLDSLMSYLGGFAQDFLSAAGVRCRLDVPLRLPALPVRAEVRHNLFLAFKEAVHNVVRHAGATEVHVCFHHQSFDCRLTLRDNGRGFTPHSAEVAPVAETRPARPASGNGLTNMHQRLEEIGGQCTIDSMPGQGTRVTFSFSLANGPARPADLS